VTRRSFRQRANELVEIQGHELEQLVRALAESQWHEPVGVVYLGFVAPTFEVPGLCKDGTVKVKRKRLVRRFFGKILRGTVGGLLVAMVSVLVGDWLGSGGSRKRFGRVAGPENAQALGPVNAARSAGGHTFLVYSAREADGPMGYSPSHVALVSMGLIHEPDDNSPPKFVWHAARPHVPLIFPEEQRLTWSDGSVFEYHIGDMRSVLFLRSQLRREAVLEARTRTALGGQHSEETPATRVTGNNGDA
jgi:hypothetical protein